MDENETTHEFTIKTLTPKQHADAFNELARRANKPDRWEVRDGELVKIK
jgi:hypothetical protein